MKRLSETNGRVIVVKMIELQCRTPSEAHRTIDVRHITFYECELHAHCMMDLDMHDVQLHMCNVCMCTCQQQLCACVAHAFHVHIATERRVQLKTCNNIRFDLVNDADVANAFTQKLPNTQLLINASSVSTYQLDHYYDAQLLIQLHQQAHVQ